MDPADLEAVVPPALNSEKALVSDGDKRPVENEDDLDSGVRLHKKAKGNLSMDMKEVAEIVLVLSAMGKMRGGRNPTDAEKRLVAVARQKLAEMCEALAPKDILPRDAVKVVIEDLGLNSRSKDQRLGFRPPKMSIAERLLLTKRKMEESKGFSIQSGTYSSHLSQVGFGATVESRASSLQAAHMFPPEKPFPTPVSVGVFQPVPTMVHVSALSSTSSMNQFSVNEVQPAVVPRVLSGSSLEKDSSLTLPRTEAAHFRLDGRLNGPAFASQVQENSGEHQLEKAPTVSLQPQSFAVARVGQPNKVSDHTPIMPEGSSNISGSQLPLQAAKDEISKPSVIQTTSGSLPSVQPSRGINFIQNPSPYNNHNDIARNVQKFLQPRLPEHLNWIPPSVEYMNKVLTCQICKATICDVESLLVCDACEKGVHLRCLQSYNHKGIPKGEWHCPKCIISSNGKPLPPKYGRVTRNSTAPKLSSNTNGGLISAEKNVESSDKKINHQKAVANGNPGVLDPAVVASTGSNHTESAPELKISSVRETHGSDFTISRVGPEESMETAGLVCAPLSGLLNDSSDSPIQSGGSSSCDTGRSNSDFKSLPKVNQGHNCPDKPSVTDTNIDSCHCSQASCNPLDSDKKGSLYHEASRNQDLVNSSTPKELEKSDLRETSECNSGCEIWQENQNLAQTGSVKASDVGNGPRDCNRSSFDDLHGVDWVGDILHIVDEKSFYRSCRVNGVVYKLHDHALFCSNSDNLRPSKLQALWEDNKTRSKWAIVNRCYLPGDLPEVVGQPCIPENNEVYESNHDSTVMAGLIQGPCQVLPPNKFKEESVRRSHLLHGENDGLQPVFLCKWFYDESKGLFRAVTD